MLSPCVRGTTALLCLSCTGAAAVRPAPPSFELRDSHGSKRSLSAYRGKVVVLSFWATWCSVCKAEIPSLNRIHREYAKEGVAVVSIAMDARGWPAVTPFILEHGIEYPVLLGTTALARAYGGVRTLPLTLFLDREGRVVARHNARLSEAGLRRVVESLLSEARDSR